MLDTRLLSQHGRFQTMNRNRISKKHLVVIAAIIAFICLEVFTGNKKDIGAVKTFDCNVKAISWNTDITVSSEGKEVYSITGNIFKVVTDPLTLYDTSGNKLAHAGDNYNLITQDNHMITTSSERLKMVGHFNILGDSYDICVNGVKVAFAKFNALNTYGTIVDNDGNLMADYTSRFLFKDYTIQATDKNFFSDEALNLIFASFYSDQAADSRSSSHGSTSSNATKTN